MNEGYRSTPVVAGVYFLFKEDELVYVGQSKDCYGRIDSHRKNGRKFDFATVMPLDTQFVGRVEKALIKAYRPPENTAHNKPPPEPRLPAGPKPRAPRSTAAREPRPLPRLIMPDEPKAPPGPDGLGLISQTQARKLAVSYGLPSTTVDKAAQEGRITLKPMPRSGRMVQVGVYADIARFLATGRKAKLDALGFGAGEECSPASSSQGGQG